MQFLSVCSGIEAASVAWEPLGWQAAALAEIEPFPAHVLHQRHGASRPMFMPDPEAVPTHTPKGCPRPPCDIEKDRRARANAIKAVSSLPLQTDLPNFGDMTQFKEWPDVPIDLLVGGTPCQSFSVAGLRKGLDDPRGNLALTYLAIAARYRPRWLVWENVPGVLSSGKGRDFGSFLGGLGQLGYGFAYRVLDAQYVRTCALPFAVPQRRRRVFVVGYLGDWRPAAAALFDGQSLRGDPAPRREAGKIAAPTLAARTRGGGGLGTDFDVDGGLIPEVSPTIRAGGNKTGGDRPPGTDVDTCETLVPCAIQERAVSENPDAAPDGAGFRQDGAAYTLEARTVPQAVAHALRGEGFDASEDGTGRGTPLVPVSVHGTQDPDVQVNIAHTLGRNSGQENAVFTRWAVRRLSTVECERLQGFPDRYTEIAWRGKDPENCPDGPRYKALGNSMATNAMGWLGERIQLVEDILGGTAA